MGHILVTVPHRFQFCLLLVDALGEGKVRHFLGDVSHEDPRHRLLKVLHFPCLYIHVEGLLFLTLLQILLIQRARVREVRLSNK